MEENIQEFTITCNNREAIGFTNNTEELVIPGFFVGDGNNETMKGQTYRVTKIDVAAFYACKKLQIVRFPETLKLISFRSFEQCVSLKNVDTSKAKNLTTISLDAFWDCPKLKTFVIPENVTGFCRPFRPEQLCRIESKSSVYKSIQDGQLLINTEQSSVVWASTQNKNLVLPPEINKIDSSAFLGRTYVFVPKTVQNIVEYSKTLADGVAIIIDKPKDSIPNAPWGIENAHIYWIG